MQSAGAGALYERFLRLRARLEAEGLFDPALKRPLPPHPRAIGVVTSLAGAALHDVRRRWRAGRRTCRSCLSERRPGSRCAGGALPGHRARRPARRSRHPDRLPRRRLARGPLGLQRRARRARDPRGADARRERRRPRDRRDARRPRRRPARADADRGRRARGAGDGGAASGARRPRRGAGEAQRERPRDAGAAPRPRWPCAWRARARRWRGARHVARPARASASPRRRHAPWPPADRVPTRPRLAFVTRSRSRGRASRRGSTRAAVRLEALDPHRVLARGYALLVDARRSAGHVGRPSWRSAPASARVLPTAGPSSRRRRSSRRAAPR